MPGKGNATLVLGAVGAIVLIFIAAVLGYIKPQWDSKAEIELLTADQMDRNALLQAEIDALAEESKNLDDYRAQLVDVASDLPYELNIPGLRRELVSIYAEAGLTLTEDNFGVPVVVENFVSLAEASAVVEAESQVDGLQFAGLLAVPVNMNVSGSHEQINAFLDAVQRGDHRYMQVAAMSFRVGSTVNPDGSAGPNGLNLTLSVNVFVLLDGSGSTQEIVAASEQAAAELAEQIRVEELAAFIAANPGVNPPAELLPPVEEVEGEVKQVGDGTNPFLPLG